MAANLGIDPALFAYICQSVENTPFYKLIGIQLTALGPGEAEIQLKAAPQHTNPLGLLHGGVLMSIADAAMGNAIRSLGIKGVTADCSISFLASASLDGLLLAKGLMGLPLVSLLIPQSAALPSWIIFLRGTDFS